MKSTWLLISTIALSAITVLAEQVSTDSWPDFRGPFGSGHVDSPSTSTPRGLPIHWSETKNVTWKTRIPLTGLSSPIIQDGKVWLTTATEDGHDYFVLCVDASTGKILLNKKIFHWDDPQSLGNGRGNNCYATPSAVVEDQRVYVHYGSSGTACLDTQSFNVVWSRKDIPCWHYRGASSSPVLFKDSLILTMDGADLQYHIALDKKTGATLWKTDRSVEWNDEDVDRPMVREGDWRKAHSTPILTQRAGSDRMYSVGAKAIYGYDPNNGQEIWRAQFHNWSAAPRPVLHDDHVMFVTGFSRAELSSVKLGGEGDITDTHYRWRVKNPIPRYASPIIVDGLLYLAAEESFLSCLDPETGEAIWTERVGGKFRASPIYVDGKLFFFSTEGTTTILKPGKEFDLIASNTLAGGADDKASRRPSGFVASPAVSGRALFLRTRDFLYRIEEQRSN